MKVAIITDQHFGARGDSLIFQEYFGKFYEELFFPTIDKLKIKTILNLGDFTDRRKYINFNILNKVKHDFINPIVARGIEMHIAIGNHDATFKSTNAVNSCEELFAKYDNIHVYTEATNINVGGLDICLVPWINMENYDRSMKMIEKSTAKVCMGHLELAGFQMYRGIKNDIGMDKSIFDKFDQVFSGHFHHKSDDGKVFYLGSPYEMTFADLNDPKGFHLYDTETQDLTFVQNPYRIFHRIYYDDEGITKYKDLLKKPLDKYQGTYVKLVVTKKTNVLFFEKYLEDLYSVQPADISVIEDFSNHESDDELDVAEDTLTILGKYVDGMELDVDKDRIKDYLRGLYLEASNMEFE